MRVDETIGKKGRRMNSPSGDKMEAQINPGGRKRGPILRHAATAKPGGRSAPRAVLRGRGRSWPLSLIGMRGARMSRRAPAGGHRAVVRTTTGARPAAGVVAPGEDRQEPARTEKTQREQHRARLDSTPHSKGCSKDPTEDTSSIAHPAEFRKGRSRKHTRSPAHFFHEKTVPVTYSVNTQYSS